MSLGFKRLICVSLWHLSGVTEQHQDGMCVDRDTK